MGHWQCVRYSTQGVPSPHRATLALTHIRVNCYRKLKPCFDMLSHHIHLRVCYFSYLIDYHRLSDGEEIVQQRTTSAAHHPLALPSRHLYNPCGSRGRPPALIQPTHRFLNSERHLPSYADGKTCKWIWGDHQDVHPLAFCG